MRIEWLAEHTVEEALALFREMHVESRFNDIPIDETRLRQAVEGSVNDQTGRIFFALARSDAGEAVGLLFGRVERPFFTREIFASDNAVFVSPPHRGTGAALKLLRAFRLWAEKRGAAEVHVSQTVGVDMKGFDRLMRRAGFSLVGGNYALRLGSGSEQQ